MADIALLNRLIEPEAQALGLALVRVQMNGGKSDPTLQIMAERPDTRQLDLTDCEALSRRISDMLDEQDPIEEAYRLEVSSPGIDRPLTRLQDFQDWAGFEARIKLVEPRDGRKQYEAALKGIEGDDVLLYVERVGELTLPFTAIASAKLILTDALLKATAPLNADGADEIVELDADDGVEPTQEG
ncbi:ribosome maturation protein RimP [Sphingomonas montana]|uniref:ribosome maturation protein RimP n=1 Tax=Sphingomonas montana TaxID=1843236 RepID=UPI00096D8C2E|nr:ribosome maturation protein RimP [Sphingomonas montana]